MSTEHHPDTSAAPDDLTARALAGPHRHWDTFDMTLEGSRFHRLHEIVSSPAPDIAAATEVISQINAFARGYGEGQADSFLYDHGGMSDDEFEEDTLAAIRRDELMSSYDETQYFEYVSMSNRLITEASTTQEARDLVRWLTINALDAFCRGRDQRLEDSQPAEAPAP